MRLPGEVMAPRRISTVQYCMYQYELGITCGRKVVADSSFLLAVHWVLRGVTLRFITAWLLDILSVTPLLGLDGTSATTGIP
ncbi:hypothetical protein AVEN_230629-1 [Araneus ventricosus]|uniref:Uncharacterized protein n=1 Tax=Araneus ventricosus TaxID=182803 RepID=A0A4Y2A1I0_ARAVE|nr:hypothetical protein AVEN_230629-1 [Araneus ventricosus]